MRTFNKKGTAMVEGAMVFPLILLITAALISLAVRQSSAVRDAALQTLAQTEEGVRERDVSEEDLMRLGWTF